jgi:hypothetical protein
MPPTCRWILGPHTAGRAKLAASAIAFGKVRSRLYHKPTCRGAATMSDKNRVESKTAAEAEAAGYRQAGDCR